MYCVYGYGTPARLHEDLTDALNDCEALRKAGVAFVTMAHENPNMVGKQGVAAPDANYDWPKRR
jgi:hypothetical protein